MRRTLCTLFLILATGLDVNPAAAADNAAASQAARFQASLPLISISRHSNGELFFDIDDSAPASTDRAARPRRVRVYWDHSASRADDDLEAERDLLQRYLNAVHPGIIDLVLFSGGAPDVRIVEAPDEAAQLDEILRDVRYEGTGSVQDIADLPLPLADVCLYFSDGVISVDPADTERIRCPLFTISSSEDADRGLLRVLARRSAGAHFDLSTMGADDVVARLTGHSPRILSVASSEGRDIAYALMPSSAGRFRIIGPLPQSGEIVVTLASGAKRMRSYALKGMRELKDDGIGALWAVDRLHELCAKTEPDSARIVALARRYSLDQAVERLQ